MSDMRLFEQTMLYRAAVEREAPLAPADHMTVRDLMRLSGHGGEEVQALLTAMFLAINEGSICLRFDEASLAKKLGLLLDDGPARELARRLVSQDPPVSCPGLVSSDEKDYKPLVFARTPGGAFLYFQKYPHYEIALKTALRALVGARPEQPAKLPAVQAALADVLEKRPLRYAGKPVVLNDEQRIAACLPLLQNLVIISGGPGTGKTSIVITILRCLARLGIAADRIRVTAPTGRAARRLTDAVRLGLASVGATLAAADAGLAAIAESTIHRLLGYNPRRNAFFYTAENPLPVDVVVVDEVSMVDIVLMARLLEAVPPGAKVILLGDKDQLPSVEAGAVLADLIPGDEQALFSEEMRRILGVLAPGVRIAGPSAPGAGAGMATDRLVILKESYRSGAGILEVARRVNGQDAAVADDIPLLQGSGKRLEWPDPRTGGVAFLDAAPGDIREWRRVLDAWISRSCFSRHETKKGIAHTYAECVAKARSLDLSRYDAEDRDDILRSIFAYLEQGKILAFMKRGMCGTYWTNRYIARRLAPVLDRAGRYGAFAGSPVMITENDQVHGLYNGDVGVILRGKDGSHRAVFQRQGGFATLGVSELPSWEPAFAITVHKSQGSEYDSVLLALPQDASNRLQSKEIVYTALTRARYFAAIYGSRDVLRAAVSRRVERQSGLKLWE